MRTLIIDQDTIIEAYSFSNRNNWGHKADLKVNNEVVCKDKCIYYNRTWERFQYDTVISCLLDKCEKKKLLTTEQIQIAKNKML